MRGREGAALQQLRRVEMPAGDRLHDLIHRCRSCRRMGVCVGVPIDLSHLGELLPDGTRAWS